MRSLGLGWLPMVGKLGYFAVAVVVAAAGMAVIGMDLVAVVVDRMMRKMGY